MPVAAKRRPSLAARKLATWLCVLWLATAFLGAQVANTPAPALAITGDVPAPLTLTTGELAQMPREGAALQEKSGEKAVYEGVALQQVLEKAGVGFGPEMKGRALAGYVVAEARDGYAVVFSLGELAPGLGATRALVADKRDGKPLGADQGPLRLVVPGDKEGARSVRMLEKLEVVKLRK